MTKRLLLIAFIAIGIVSVHLTIVRPWFMRWGATDREVDTVWPGDEIVPHAGIVATRAVTVDAAQ
jgi:hypothetical protein